VARPRTSRGAHRRFPVRGLVSATLRQQTLRRGRRGARPWLFRGTGLRVGSSFGRYGIEVDERTAASPRGIEVLARIANIFGPGKSAAMSYYTTPQGAKVFAAGAINFGGSALWPGVRRMMENLWIELSRP